MDSGRFDDLVRMLGVSTRRRTALGGLLGAAAASVLSLVENAEIASAKKRRCRGGKKKCGRRCIPNDDCCRDAECGTNMRCASGACESCLGQGTACTDDDQCCTGICDTYTDKCQQVRVECENGEPCPGGRCCDVFGPQCLYVTATQGACVPDGEPNESCGYVVCGNACSDLSDDTYQYCGFEGSAACRNGRCCCPRGIPLEDCPSFEQGEDFLPRCPKDKKKKRR